MFFKKKKILGIDIGTSSIKISELDVSKKGAKLINFAMIETPASSISSGDVVEVSPICSAIREAIVEYKFQAKNVASGLWGGSVLVKKITIPSMDRGSIAEQIRWEAEQYIPFDLSEVNIDFYVLGSGSTQAIDSMEVLIIAAKHDQIYKFVEIVESSGLSCTHLDVNGFALANIFELNYGSTEGQMVGLFNIGAHYTNFVVIKNKDVIFCRDINVGGHIYTKEIQKNLSLDFQESEAHKINMSTGRNIPEEVVRAVEIGHEVFVDDIRASVDFFVNTTQGANLDKCYITGGGSKISGLLEYLEHSLKVPCLTLDPFMAIDKSSSSVDPEYLEQIADFASVSLGLGLRVVGDS